MFRTIEGHWPRRDYFHHYMDNLRCTFSMTVQIDITALRAALRQSGVRAYPAQIHMLADTVNRFPEFRMGLSGDGAPGYWGHLDPAYAVLVPDTGTFCSIWTPWNPDFGRFYEAWTGDVARYGQAQVLRPQGEIPPNVFDISSLPWVEFTAFNLNVYTEGTHLLPIFTLGKYVEENGKTLLPLALQLHHAACDGYHAGLFVAALRERAAGFRGWL